MTTTAAVLRLARAKIAQGWCQGQFARDQYGCASEPVSPTACAWCAAGALRAVSANWVKVDVAHEALRSIIGGMRVVSDWNDTAGRTQEQVLAAFDAAISYEEARP